MIHTSPPPTPPPLPSHPPHRIRYKIVLPEESERMWDELRLAAQREDPARHDALLERSKQLYDAQLALDRETLGQRQALSGSESRSKANMLYNKSCTLTNSTTNLKNNNTFHHNAGVKKILFTTLGGLVATGVGGYIVNSAVHNQWDPTKPNWWPDWWPGKSNSKHHETTTTTTQKPGLIKMHRSSR